MNLLLDSLRHNTWATVRLLRYCAEQLSHSELHDRSEGIVYGSVYSVFQHYVVAEHANYRKFLTDEWPTRWPWQPGETDPQHPAHVTLEVMEARAKDSLALWEEFLAGDVDGDHVIIDRGRDGTAVEVRLGVFFAQLLNHANHHRAEVTALITRLGKEPPDVSGWSYGQEAGRGAPAGWRE